MEGDPMAGLESDEWSPPVPQLNVMEIQRGIYSVYPVKNERASNPFGSELEHWSALPALSYFVLNAVSLRERMRRVMSPTTFKPPPRLTLSEKRKEQWFSDLKDVRVSLRRLSRAIPHGYSSNNLLDMLAASQFPVNRAVWFIKCIAANEVRAIKRKQAADSDPGKIEETWMAEWTRSVIGFVVRTIDSFDNNEKENWKQHIQYASRITLTLYNASLLDKQVFLDWLLVQLREAPVVRLPCLVHLVQLLWKPLTSEAMAHRLLRSIAQRMGSGDTSRLNCFMEPIILKLATTNEDTFVNPRSWPTIGPHLRSHPAYVRLAARNQAFMMADPHDPSDWSLPLEAGSLMDNFSRPYRIDDLTTTLMDLDMNFDILLHTILTRTLRQASTASIQLGIALLKRIRVRDSSLPIAAVCADFTFHPQILHGSAGLDSLVSELLSTRLFDLGRYVNRLISSGVLYAEGGAREVHLRILRNLPFDKLNPSIRSHVTTILYRLKEPVTSQNLEAYLTSAADIFQGKPYAGSRITDLSLNDRQNLTSKLVHLFETRVSQDVAVETPSSSPGEFVLDSNVSPTTLVNFVELVEQTACGSIKPVFRVLSMALASRLSGASIVSCVLRQVHVRLMALVCAGLIDTFATQLVVKLQQSLLDVENDHLYMPGQGNPRTLHSPQSHHQNHILSGAPEVFNWVGWDDISALRAVIQTPSIMVELNRLVPLRPTFGERRSMADHTPAEQDTFKLLLYRPGCPDVGTLLTMRGQEGLGSAIVEYSQSPAADLTALLQLVTYHIVSIEELVTSSSDKFEILRFLLLSQSNERGFCLEEVEALRAVRRKYLQTVALGELIQLCSSVPPIEFISRVAHLYPDIFINRMLWELIDTPDVALKLLDATRTEFRSFGELLIRCSPFSLRFYQGLVVISFHGTDSSAIADEIFRTAFAHPEASSALQGLLQNIDLKAKELMFIRAVNEFLSDGLKDSQLQYIDIYSILIAALAPSIKNDVKWDLDKVPDFLEWLVRAATDISNRQVTVETREHWQKDVKVLRKALTLVLRISVVGRLHNVPLPGAASPYLEALMHVQVFADNYRVRTFIKDANRLLLRIASTKETSCHPLRQKMLSSGPNALDGLKLYSKSHNQYNNLPVWPFDLIEHANHELTRNDCAIDLSMFETYEDQ